MPRAILGPDELVHIFNRGVNKQLIFLDQTDYARMLFHLLLFQSPLPVHNVSRSVSYFKKDFSLGHISDIKDRVSSRTVELISFVLMPNHFHIVVKELEEGGTSSYLQRIEIAYTKYFNIKYVRSGYLLQGPFQSVNINTNSQLLHLSAYVHYNPRELKKWKGKEDLYAWSSYQDFVSENRWGELLSRVVILDQFKDLVEYKNFVETSGVKDSEVELFID